jgi:hypothetical protein
MGEGTAISIEAIAKAHPKNMKPIAAQRAICEQLDTLTRSMPVHEAMDYLLKRTQLYAEYVSRWPVGEFKFVQESHNWFKDGCYAADEKLWVYVSPNGNGHSEAPGIGGKCVKHPTSGSTATGRCWACVNGEYKP